MFSVCVTVFLCCSSGRVSGRCRSRGRGRDGGACRARRETLEAFDDGDVGLTAALAHGLQPVPAPGPFELVQ
ncbi:hypothetical protein ACFFX0_30835 [Citricoccus parietis]|uniref:Secreted protein n=1 Tax=Citricoccus parietis TaxID=592307 RepID=A0ABV5G916_9MICC